MTTRNMKLELIERERIAYIDNNPVLAQFFADTLDYIGELEDRVNAAESVADEENQKYVALRQEIRNILEKNA